ncbi:hypothetical protein BN6_14010 [Saccharothrix espanaensis DSM 44229]|uniref:Uncharacterized protein n=1 Tax=Saccharothrix espanaensis (strain ATCC 51144 / DSM 44229 / JCM 9112 / NBRC 15066 / NRRL 15764) TaxID=1179773 RepID=K0JPH8_SACES|nr:hypothetical protein BN6_14010 [Saccharothrix espanaensis DSM 44229]
MAERYSDYVSASRFAKARSDWERLVADVTADESISS